MDLLLKLGSLKEVDLSLPEKELPDLKGKSRKEILEILANNVGEEHETLLNALKDKNIETIVTPVTKNIYVRNCNWDTLLTISKLVDALKYELIVSGGGMGKYSISPIPTSIDFDVKSYTNSYHINIAKSCTYS